MTGALLPRDELAVALETCLTLPGMDELLDPLFLLRARELLVALESVPASGSFFEDINQIGEVCISAVRHRYAELTHEQLTLNELINKNHEVAVRLNDRLAVDQFQSQEARQSFNIARKLITRQGRLLLTHIDNEHIEQLIARHLLAIQNCQTTNALTQAMHALISDAFTLFEGYERQNRQILNVVEAVYERFNQLPGFTLELPQLSVQDDFRLHLQQLSEKTSEFCRRTLNLLTDQTRLIKKFSVEVVNPLRNSFNHLYSETVWWLNELPIPVQNQIQKHKITLEKRRQDIDMIQDQIAILTARMDESSAALAQLQKHEATIEWLLLLTQSAPIAKLD